MQNIVVVGFHKALASAITGVADLLALAGVSWNRIQGEEPERLFNVRIASPDGEPIRCINGLMLGAHMSYDQITSADALIVPSIGGVFEEVLANAAPTLELKRRIMVRLDTLNRSASASTVTVSE